MNLELPNKSVDLDEVEGLSDEEWEGLLYYAKQWDDPKQAEWVEALTAARGGDVEAAEGYDGMSVDELKSELAGRDLPVSGNKADLIDRLKEADAE
jgi:hypothetical protein